LIPNWSDGSKPLMKVQNKMSNDPGFTNNLFLFMEETFESKNHGIYLDNGTSLFETLDTVSAEEASVPVGGKCASLQRRSRMSHSSSNRSNDLRCKGTTVRATGA